MSGSDDLVAKRLRYVARQRELHAETLNVPAGRQPRGTGPTNRHGMPAVPVGQHTVPNWPVLDLGSQPDVPLDRWELAINGLVENLVTISWRDFMALEQVEDVSDFHCVTTWSRLDNRWRGVRFRTLMELAVPQERARFVHCTGHDKEPGSGIEYTTSLPLARAVEDDVLLVHTWEDRPLPREHGGPCRMITPKLYAWKGTKWIHTITLFAEDERGFWERRGYSNTAEPWLNDRYSQELESSE